MICCFRVLKITKPWQTWKKSPWHFGLAVKPNVVTSRILPRLSGLKGLLEKHLLSRAGMGVLLHTAWRLPAHFTKHKGYFCVVAAPRQTSCTLPDNI